MHRLEDYARASDRTIFAAEWKAMISGLVLLCASLAHANANAMASPEARVWALRSQARDDALDPSEHARIAARLQTAQRAWSLYDGATSITAATTTPNLAWPLSPAPGFTPYGYHGVSNFVDHDPRFPGFVQDYTCGSRTYDDASGYNHAGTDYFLWPFPWLMMDEQDVRIVAAAPGIIIEKDDGNFDRDCALGAATSFNAVFVLQDDGLTAWYLHMKNGSLTSLPLGSRVAGGDYLGTVGSSGSSTGPHLHFELTDAQQSVVDPHHGQCSSGADRWIVSQPYEDPRIDTLSTHSAEPVSVDCGVDSGAPVHETPAYRDHFQPGDALWVFASYSDHRIGEVTHFSVTKPDGSIFTQWDFDLASQHFAKPFYSGTGFDWKLDLPADAPIGTWSVVATFEGKSYMHAFTVAPLNLDQHGLTGAWYNPATGGQGLLIETYPDLNGNGRGILAAGWYTFDLTAAGGQRWYTLQGTANDGDASSTLGIYAATGGNFNAPPRLGSPTRLGSAILGFTDCANGTLQYAFDDGRSGTIALSRGDANVSCSAAGDTAAAAQDYLLSGAWYDPVTSGQGFFFDFNPAINLLFGAWYTFAPDGATVGGVAGQRWYTIQDNGFASGTLSRAGLPIYETIGGTFNAGKVSAGAPVGTADITIASCASMHIAYRFSAGTNAGRSGTIDLVRVVGAPHGCSL